MIMNELKLLVLILASALLIGGCSSERLKRAGYEAAYNNQCMRDTGLPNCNLELMGYDEYSRQREQALDDIQNNK